MPDGSNTGQGLSTNRRRYLYLLGVGGAGAIAGCGGGDGGDGTDGDDGGDGTDGSDGGDGTDGSDGGDGTDGGDGSDGTDGDGDDGDGGDGGDGLTPGGHFRTTAITPPQSLSPLQGTGQGDFVFFEMMYDRLTRFNRDLEIEPGLATEWLPNDAADSWTFILREGATFATIDQEVLAQDVEATVEVMRSEDKAPGAAADLGPVDTVEVEDDYRIRFDLTRVDPFYHKRLAETGSWFNIVPQNVAENRFDELATTDFGSGPFTLASFESGNQYVFDAYDDWYVTDDQDRALPYVDQVTVDVIPDTVAQVNALTDNRVDALNILERTSRSRVENTQGSQIQQYATPALLSMVLTTNMELDNGDRPFEDVRVRKAMKHALDREEIVAATGGTMTIGHHDPVAPVHPGYAPFDEGLEFGTTAQPDRARELLAEAGYEDGLTLPTPIYENEFQARRGTCVQLFQEQCREAGIEFDIQLVSSDTWLSDYWNQDGVWYASGYAARLEQTTVPRLAMRSDGPWNSGRWSSARYDEQYDIFSSTTTDDPAFEDAFHQAQRISHLNNAWIVFGFLDQIAAHNGYVSHYDGRPSPNKDSQFDAALTPEAPQGP